MPKIPQHVLEKHVHREKRRLISRHAAYGEANETYGITTMTSVENEAAHFRVAITNVMGYAHIIDSQLCGPIPPSATQTVRRVINPGNEIVCGMDEIMARAQQDAKSRSGTRLSALMNLFCAETDRTVSEIDSLDIDKIEEARYRDYLAEIKSSARSAKSAITACFAVYNRTIAVGL